MADYRRRFEEDLIHAWLEAFDLRYTKTKYILLEIEREDFGAPYPGTLTIRSWNRLFPRFPALVDCRVLTGTQADRHSLVRMLRDPGRTWMGRHFQERLDSYRHYGRPVASVFRWPRAKIRDCPVLTNLPPTFVAGGAGKLRFADADGYWYWMGTLSDLIEALCQYVPPADWQNYARRIDYREPISR